MKTNATRFYFLRTERTSVGVWWFSFYFSLAAKTTTTKKNEEKSRRRQCFSDLHRGSFLRLCYDIIAVLLFPPLISLGTTPPTPPQVVSCVRLLPMLGPSCDNSEVIENAILLETPLPPPPCPRPFSTPFSGPHQPLPAGTRPQEQTAKTAAATATRGPRGWAALDGPVSVALFEASLQMETRDPFSPDADSGLQADFFSGKRSRLHRSCKACTYQYLL